MRLLKNLGESRGNTSISEILTIIYTKCMPFIKEVSKNRSSIRNLPYSGRKHNADYYVKSVPKNRTPKDTPEEVHRTVDDAFKSKFGFRARSEVMFVTGNPGQAISYGKVYCIIPLGNFKFLWSPSISDLFMDIESYTSAEAYEESNENKRYDLENEARASLEERWEEEFNTPGKEGSWEYEGDILRISELGRNKNKMIALDKVERLVKGFKYPGSLELLDAMRYLKVSDPEEARKELLDRLHVRDVKWLPDMSIDEYINDEMEYEVQAMMDNQRDSYSEWLEKQTDYWVGENIKKYKDKDLVDAINSKKEIMLHCKEYLAISDIYEEVITNYIIKNGTALPNEVRVKEWYMKTYGRLPKQLNLFDDL